MKNAMILLLITCCTLSTSYATTVTKQSNNSKNRINSDVRPKFRIGFNAPQIDHRQLLLTIDANTSDGVDFGYDAEMYQVIEDDMYWLLEDRKFVIQATNEVSFDKEIPLGIIMSASGDIEIQVDALENPITGLVVYLKDLELNKLYNIQDSIYRGTLAQGEYHSKFAITFKSSDYVNGVPEEEEPRIVEVDTTTDSVLSDNINDIEESELHVFYNNRSTSIIIKRNGETNIKRATLYNIRGRKIKNWKNKINKKRNVLPVNVKKGVYVIHVKTEGNMLRKRLLIK